MKKTVRVALQYTLDHDAASYGKLLQQTLVMVCSDSMFIQKAFLALILARVAGGGERQLSSSSKNKHPVLGGRRRSIPYSLHFQLTSPDLFLPACLLICPLRRSYFQETFFQQIPVQKEL